MSDEAIPGVDNVEAVVIDCTLAGVSRRADKSATIRLATSLEAPVTLMTWLDAHHQGNVQVLISTNSKADALEYTGEKDEKGRTRSQELRSLIYGYWNELKQRGDHDIDDFTTFYDKEMESIIADYLTRP